MKAHSVKIPGLIYLVPLFLVVCVCTAAGNATIKPVNLRCEYRVNPLGVDEKHPRLSWRLRATGEKRGLTQSAYRVLVATDPEKLTAERADLWDSGWVESDRQLHVAYEGTELNPRQRCWWKVRVRDGDGNSSAWSEPAMFSVGLFDREQWEADWISDSNLGEATSEPHNGYHSTLAASADTTKWVGVDLGQTRRIEAVRLWPARPYNWEPDTPGFLFPLRFRVEVASSRDFSDARTVVDRTGSDVPNPGTKAPTYRFDPVRARYLRLVATKLRARDHQKYGLALAEMEVLSERNNVARGTQPMTKNDPLDSIETSGWGRKKLVDGRLRSTPAGTPRPATMLRKPFRVDDRVERATLHVTGLGLYELRLNGEKVGRGILAPEFTKYSKRVQYRSFDVTNLLRQGENAVGALLGDGWYASKLFDWPPVHERTFAGRRGLLMRLDLHLADGRVKTVTSDETWRSTTDGPIRSASIYDGETLDARRNKPGWDTPDFDDGSWNRAKTVEFEKTKIVWQPNRPIRVTRELTPVNVTEPEPGTYVFDMGQNMVGWCRLQVDAPSSTKITLRHGERLKRDGTVYTDNLRNAEQLDTFICGKEGEETFEPHFTYHGFRYVQVEGLPDQPEKKDLVGRVFHSAAPRTGWFESSNELINQLMDNILRTQRGNMMSIPTDCPQRDERHGWMGDAQAFSQTAMFNMNMASFFTKWLRDVRDSQHADGCYPPFAPAVEQRGAPAWGDAGVIVPWRLYVNYADRRLLERHFSSARRWVDYVHEHNPDLIWRNRRAGDYGDWLNGDTLNLEDWPGSGAAVPKVVFATAYFARSAELVKRMAAVLDRPEDERKYSQLAGAIKKAFRREFIDGNGRIEGDTMAGYALGLRFGLLPREQSSNALDHILRRIERYGGHLSTGIQTTHRLMLELSRRDHHDLAGRLINQRTVPSWGYMIEQEATTIWERWDGYVEGRGMQNPSMNSFNHYVFGSVGEWVWRNIAGIHPDPEHPGYRHVIIRPRPHETVTSARGTYRSIRGPITVDWAIEKGRMKLETKVPPNATATVHVPTSSPEDVRESERPAADAPGVRSTSVEEDGYAVYDIGSGHYVFTGPAPGRR